jgi:hypothetical protein
MAIHAIVSSYFGEYEYDLNHSLNWTRNFCDTVYVLDNNISQKPRVDIERIAGIYDNIKYGFEGVPFFGVEEAASWRKRSYALGKQAWNYENDDWVIFVDGTEGLNFYHAVPVDIELTGIETIGGDTLTFTSVNHNATVGNRVTITSLIYTIDSIEFNFSGSYFINEVTEDTFTVTSNFLGSSSFEEFDSPVNASYTTEPDGYFTGDFLKCWINHESNKAQSESKDFVSIPFKAMVRSGTPKQVIFKSFFGQEDVIESNVTTANTYWLPAEDLQLVRLGKVSGLDSLTDWTILDQLSSSFPEASTADNLSILSYAYLRWAENPVQMTQSVDSTAPNYSSTKPLFPLSELYDVGFSMRKKISNVRPLDGAPFDDWNWEDDEGIRPLSNGHALYELELLEHPGGGYTEYGGTPLYTKFVRSRLKGGVDPNPTAAAVTAPIRVPISAGSASDGFVTIKTSSRHSLTTGMRIVVFGAGKEFDGSYVVHDVPLVNGKPSTNLFRYAVTNNVTVPTTPLTVAQLVVVPNYRRQIRWDYALNKVGMDDPVLWVSLGTDNSFRTVDRTYTLLDVDSRVLVDASTRSINIILTSAVDNEGKAYLIQRTDNSDNPVTIVPILEQTIDSLTELTLDIRNTTPPVTDGSVFIISDGTNWLSA